MLLWHKGFPRVRISYMYKGIVDTLHEGFLRSARPTRVISGAGVNCKPTPDADAPRGCSYWPREGPPALHANISLLRRGDVFVFIGEFLPQPAVPWNELRARGVVRIHYQTEPRDGCALAADHMYARQVDELWDYSWHNLQGCGRRIAWHDKVERRRNAGRPAARHNATSVSLRRWRYVPVGSQQQLLPKWIARARQARSNATGPGSSCLFFLGNPYEHGGSRTGGRARCFAQLLRALGPALRHTNRVWSDEWLLERVLTRCPLFLNLHKDCGKADEAGKEGRGEGRGEGSALEIRVPKLLDAARLVVSERSHPLDEAEFAGLVRFEDNMSMVIQAFREHTKLISTAEGRRQAERHANAIAVRFQERFAPEAIFERANVYAELLRS